MDDFGSGYSSLNMLKDYSFDELKMDMRFLSSFSSAELFLDMISMRAPPYHRPLPVSLLLTRLAADVSAKAISDMNRFTAVV